MMMHLTRSSLATRAAMPVGRGAIALASATVQSRRGALVAQSPAAAPHRLLHSPRVPGARFGLGAAALTLSNGLMEEDDFYARGVPPPVFHFSPQSPALAEIFAAHSHVDPYGEVADELARVNGRLAGVLGTDHPLLARLANYCFETAGKRIRPAILFLISRAMEHGERTDTTLRAEDATPAVATIEVPVTTDSSDATPAATPATSPPQFESIEVSIPDLATRPSHVGEIEYSRIKSSSSIADFVFSPTAAAASALDTAHTLAALAPKLSPVPLPTLPALPELPFAPFSYDASALARRTHGITEGQRRLGEIVEMIHTASLLHDDVIDSAKTRRNVPSLNAVFGNKLSILGGDFLLARASVSLARLRDPLVTESISSVIEHLVKGEIMQLKPSLTCAKQTPRDTTDAASTTSPHIPRSFFRPSASNLTPAFRADLSHYMTKSYYKTASMLAHGCRSAAILGGHSVRTQQLAEEYGKCLGLAFQIVDDVLDITATSLVLGKPAFNDLSSGVVTAPILFALEAFPEEVLPIIERRASQAGDRDVLYALLAKCDAVAKTQRLADECAMGALAAILQLKPSRAQSALVQLVQKVLTREK